MGFGGATAAMAVSLKNNNRRKTREPFRGLGTFDNESKGIKSKPISEKALAKIRTKIKKEQRALMIKRRVVFFLIVGILILIPSIV